MIALVNGLINSLMVLELLRNDEEFNSNVSMNVGTFTNCREQGLTFILCGYYIEGAYYSLKNSFTYCVYEHRNSDSIIINGKEGYISLNGVLPYKGDNSWDCYGSFKYHQFSECAEALKKLIMEHIKEDQTHKREE